MTRNFKDYKKCFNQFGLSSAWISPVPTVAPSGVHQAAQILGIRIRVQVGTIQCSLLDLLEAYFEQVDKKKFITLAIIEIKDFLFHL